MIDDTFRFEVSEEETGRRLDVVVAARRSDLSRAAVQTLIEEDRVRVNDASARASYRVRRGDTIKGEIVRTPSISAQPEVIPLEIVYQDQDLVVIDKPPGLVVHPAAGHQSGTLANALTALFPQTGDVGPAERPGIVHRLDKDTSGLMVVALTPVAHADLQRQIAARTAGRQYLALVRGRPLPESGIIDAPIGRDPSDRKRMAVHGVAGRPAATAYRTVERLEGFTLVEATLRTGRTHQIRVHFAATGHPIAGDSTYSGPRLPGLDRQFLHACKLSLRSPSTGRQLEFASELPPDLHSVLDRLREESRQ